MWIRGGNRWKQGERVSTGDVDKRVCFPPVSTGLGVGISFHGFYTVDVGYIVENSGENVDLCQGYLVELILVVMALTVSAKAGLLFICFSTFLRAL